MSKDLEVTLDLSPPQPMSSSETIPVHQTYTFSVVPSALRSSNYYASLRNAISEAKEKTGSDLTRYRDLAADAEKAKVVVNPASDEEDEIEE